MTLPDIQAGHPDVRINLTRVGVTDVKKLIEVARKGKRPIILVSTFNIFVDLPAEIKGANLSRNFEAMDEVLEEAIRAPVYEIEELCGEVSKRLLDRHEYASRSEVHMRSEYVLKHATPVTDMQCQQVVEIFAEATAVQEDGGMNIRKMIGAEVMGMTACPCTQEIMREKAVEEMQNIGIGQDQIKQFLERVPMATHNQRGRSTISIEVYNDYDVPLEKIIDIANNSMSTNIYELLKRSDEAYVVEEAHRNPKFVEDCVRFMAHRIVEEFDQLPDDSVISIKQVNEESIHQHNAFAERAATLGELRQEMRDLGYEGAR